MTVLRWQVSLESLTGLPEDASMNVWHFHTANVDIPAMIADIDDELSAFYSAIGAIYSANTITGNMFFKVFDLLDVPPRIPVFETSHIIAGLGDADALPTECAATLSFQGDPVSGVNQRRRRGRLFLGPLDIGVASTAAGIVHIQGGTRTLVTGTAESFMEAGGTLTWQWIVFSPTNAGAPPWDETALDEGSALVTNGWMDDAFDTQRRRGTAATARTTWG